MSKKSEKRDEDKRHPCMKNTPDDEKENNVDIEDEAENELEAGNMVAGTPKTVVVSELLPEKVLNFPDAVIPHYDTIIVPAGKRKIDLHFNNPIENEDKYYLTFELALVNDEESVYGEPVEQSREILFRTLTVMSGEEYIHERLIKSLKKGEYHAELSVEVRSKDITVSETDVIVMPITVKSVFVFPWWILISILAGALVVGLFCWCFFVPKPEETEQVLEAIGLDPNLGRQVLEVEEAEPGQITFHNVNDITMSSGEVDVNVNFVNPAVNEGKYDFTFTLYLTETGEVLYQSGIVPAGQELERITLNRALSPGEYDATVFVQPYQTDNQSVALNSMKFPIKLTVE